MGGAEPTGSPVVPAGDEELLFDGSLVDIEGEPLVSHRNEERQVYRLVAVTPENFCRLATI